LRTVLSERNRVVRHDHAIASLRQYRRDIDKTVDVVRPAVQQNDGSAIGRAGFGIADIEDPGIDLLERSERSVRSRLDRRQARRFGLRCCGADQTKLRDRGAERRDAKETTTVMVDLFGSINFGHGKSPKLVESGHYVRSGLRPARTSSTKSCGCSQAA
jgi:hypothetical protein